MTFCSWITRSKYAREEQRYVYPCNLDVWSTATLPVLCTWLLLTPHFLQVWKFSAIPTGLAHSVPELLMSAHLHVFDIIRHGRRFCIFVQSPWSRLCCIRLFKFVIITLHYITLHYKTRGHTDGLFQLTSSHMLSLLLCPYSSVILTSVSASLTITHLALVTVLVGSPIFSFDVYN